MNTGDNKVHELISRVRKKDDVSDLTNYDPSTLHRAWDKIYRDLVVFKALRGLGSTILPLFLFALFNWDIPHMSYLASIKINTYLIDLVDLMNNFPIFKDEEEEIIIYLVQDKIYQNIYEALSIIVALGTYIGISDSVYTHFLINSCNRQLDHLEAVALERTRRGLSNSPEM